MTTDTYQIERFIKRHLDGNFWSFDFEGRVIWNRVPIDFMPQFKRYTWSEGEENAERRQYVRRDWSMDDFRRIEKGRIKAKSWREIGKGFVASDNATAEFYKRIIKQQDENLTKEVMIRRLKIIKWMYENNTKPATICLLMHYAPSLVERVTGRIEE